MENQTILVCILSFNVTPQLSPYFANITNLINFGVMKCQTCSQVPQKIEHREYCVFNEPNICVNPNN